MGTLSLERDGAYILNISAGERAVDNRSAMRSAAELLGAHARIRVSGLVQSWRMASTMVTVFPVPGLGAGERMRFVVFKIKRLSRMYSRAKDDKRYRP